MGFAFDHQVFKQAASQARVESAPGCYLTPGISLFDLKDSNLEFSPSKSLCSDFDHENSLDGLSHVFLLDHRLTLWAVQHILRSRTGGELSLQQYHAAAGQVATQANSDHSACPDPGARGGSGAVR